MKQSPQTRTVFSTFLMVFFISTIILFGIMEFRHTNNIIKDYQTSIQQVAVNKTNLYLDGLKTITINTAKKIENKPPTNKQDLKNFISSDYQITDLYIVSRNGTIELSTSREKTNHTINTLIKKGENLKDYKVVFSDIHWDSSSGFQIVSMAIPLQHGDSAGKLLVLSFRLDQYQNEMLQVFMNNNYKVAVFDNSGKEVIWPFEKINAATFDPQQENIYYQNLKYHIQSAHIDQIPWKMYFFFKTNNFELFRAITILILVFALYICLYELLVEFWGVNSAKTYFENIDFAIFNQINEGVIIANNSGQIIFANETAHLMFADRKNTLRNVKIKEVLGNLDKPYEGNEKPFTLTLKIADKLLKAIHSPIIKNNKILGSLTVIRTNVKADNISKQVLDKLVDPIPQGVMFIDKNHELAMANLMAKCYFNNLVIGTGIDVINRELAAFIYNNIDSGVLKRIELSNGLICEISPIYDDDHIYVGTLVILINNTQNDNACI
ncbi:MAG: PAS domain-containing protein [Bacillota bacterium]